MSRPVRSDVGCATGSECGFLAVDDCEGCGRSLCADCLEDHARTCGEVSDGPSNDDDYDDTPWVPTPCTTPGCLGSGPDMADQGPDPANAIAVPCDRCGARS